MKHGDYREVRIMYRELLLDTASVQRDTWRKLHHWPMMRFGTFLKARKKVKGKVKSKK